MTWRYRVSLILALHLLYIIESGLPITALTVKVWRLCFFPFCQGQSNEQLTSTPEKDRSLSARHVKHDLTPKSKCASLPASKRRQIGVNFVIQFFARCLLPAFLCAHIFIKRETSGYEAVIAPLWGKYLKESPLLIIAPSQPPLATVSSFYPPPPCQARKINQGTKFGTLKKLMFSLFDFQWAIFEIRASLGIIAPFLCEKRYNRRRLLFEEIR